MKPRILLLDTETAPNTIKAWGVHEVDALEVIEDWYFLCFSVKWHGETRIRTHALPDFTGYRPHKPNDRKLMRKLHSYLDKADIVIAQNGDAFDIRKANARFLVHGLRPPSPYKTVDTLKALRRVAGFDSNKLDNVSRQLKLGRKLPHQGYGMWRACIAGDRKAWATMKKYNTYDVVLLERLYLKLLPWISNHPNFNMLDGRPNCPRCGGSLIRRGRYFSKASREVVNYQCKSCGGFTTAPARK